MHQKSLLICLLFVASPAIGQTVFKCTDAKGATVYSQKPCSADPKAVQEVRVRTHQPTVDPQSQRYLEEMNTVAEKAEIPRAESYCLQAANDRIYPGMRRRVAQIDRDIAQLEYKLSLANNNLAGATYATGIRQQIATLQGNRTTEFSNAETLMGNARTQCGAQRAAAERAFQERHQAPPPPDSNDG